MFFNNELDLQTLITIGITVLIALIGWTLASYQFYRQFTRSLKLKRRDIEIDVVKELIPYFEAAQKRNSELTAYLISLHERTHLITKMVEFTEHYFTEYDTKLSDRYFAARMAFSDLLYFYDHRQVILFKFKDKLKELNIESLSRNKLINKLQSVLNHIIKNRIAKQELIIEEESKNLKEQIKQIIDHTDLVDLKISMLSIAIQNEFLSDLFNYRIEEI